MIMFLYLLTILLAVFTAENAFTEKVNEYLRTKLADYQKFEFEIAQMPENYSSIEIMNENNFTLNGNMAYIPVRIVKDNRSSMSYVSIKLKLYKQVIAAARNIEKREALSQSDFELRTLDVTEYRSDPVCSIEEIKNQRAKIYLRKGEVLLKEMLENEPLVFAGDKVTAAASVGSVIVSTDAISRQDGIEGEIIRVVTKDKKIFRAKILDQNNVLIIE